MSIASEISRLQNAKIAIKASIENKGVTVDDNWLISQYAPLIDEIPSGTSSVPKKDVNFYDYDGTILYSYTKSEFLNLTALPSSPNHEWLIAGSWTYTLSTAQTYVTNYGKLNIGQKYTTPNGSTRLFITLKKGRLSPYIAFAVNGSVTIDWGDNTSQTVTGTSTTTQIYTKHDYASEGDYVITLTSSTRIYLETVSSKSILSANSSVEKENFVYSNSIKKLYLGKVGVTGTYLFSYLSSLEEILISTQVTGTYGNYSFCECSSLKHITLPSSTGITATYFLYCCYSLKSICFASGLSGYFYGRFLNTCTSLQDVTPPSSITKFDTGCFAVSSTVVSSSSLTEIIIPSSVTQIGNGCFQNCTGLSNIVLPSSITSIGSGAFEGCCGMAYYDFSSFSSIPSMGNNYVFQYIPSDCKIIVPDNLYETWITSYGFTNYTANIIKKSDWDNL